jgi:hypothetical protein
MTGNQKKIVVAAVAIAAFTWWAATSPDSPINPTPPRPSRPVLKFLGKIAVVAAKFGLGALVFMEPAPVDSDEMHLANAVLGTDGHQQLRNERW